MKKLLALLLALAMVLALAACGGNEPDPTTQPTDAPTTAPTEAPTTAPTEEPTEPAVQAKYEIGEHIEPDNDPYIVPKWTETLTEDGWYLVENEGGATLGYSPNSGVKIIQVEGFAFKDLDQDGKLDVYEDWRNSDEERALDLAAHLSGEEATPYLTHGGWGSFSTEEIDPESSGYAYIMGGGRGGVTRKAGKTTEDNVNHAKWSNLIQELCESGLYGIPGVISIDPNDQSGLVEALSLAATFDPELAVEVGKQFSIQYRAMGISMLLGPQIDLMTSPVMDRGETTYGEDPALVRDITDGYVSGMQSTFAEDGTDLGWGTDSVVTTMKHYAGAGASEGGRDDHGATGKYAVFPGNNFEAHLIAFHDGAFDLSYSSTGKAAGVMMNYSVSYSEDGSLGELVGGVFSTFKFDTLFKNWSGFIVSDWGCFPDGGRGGWGMESYTVAERIAIAITNGMTQAGGYNDLTVMAEVWNELVKMHGEEAALELVRDRAYENILMTLRLELFENPYCDTAYTASVCCTEAALAYGLETQLDSVVMLKNTDNLIKAAEEGAEKLTVYVPYVFNDGTSFSWKNGAKAGTPSWNPSLDLDVVGKYYTVVTDTLLDPSGVDAEGNAIYTENDIVRATAAELADVDLVLIGMDAPKVPSYYTTAEDGTVTWLPSSIQYNAYTAVNAKETSVAGDVTVKTEYDPYGAVISEETIVENRSYKGNTALQAANYGDLVALQHADTLGLPVVVLMQQNDGAMVWSEVEPLADAILCGYAISDEAMVMTAAGLHEPQGLLTNQQPASMDAVEAQLDDVPRDVECHVDANGNKYDFAFGMNWSGVINDERVQTYSADPLTECENIDFQYAN